MLQPGTLFDNRYELIRMIGRGGFAEVWLVRDTLSGLEEALKIYAPGGGMDEDGLKIFAKELAVVHDLRHTNLLTPKTLGQCDNQPYLILPYCPNGSLNKRIGQCTEDEAWKILRQVAAGLAYLHERGIVHQDIKPDNILVDANTDYVITDFGISLKAQSTLRKSVRVQAESGTMAYMAPERFSSKPRPVPANDIWSLGAMMFELIEGNVPFIAQMGGLAQMNGAQMPEMEAKINNALKQVIVSMLAKEADERPTAEQLTELAKQKSAPKKNVVAASKPQLQDVSMQSGEVVASSKDKKTQMIDRNQLQNVKVDALKSGISRQDTKSVQRSESATSEKGNVLKYICLGLIGIGCILPAYDSYLICSSLGFTLNLHDIMILMSDLLEVGFGIAFLYFAWKSKDAFMQNSSTTKQWLMWGVAVYAVGYFCLFLHYLSTYLNDMVFDLSGYGLILAIIGFACLLKRIAKQPKEADGIMISLKPWHILMAILGIAVVLIAVKSLIQNEENSHESTVESVEAETSASIVQPTYVDLGLPSGTMWKNVNEEGGYYSYDEAIDQFGSSLPTPEHFTELIEKCTWRWDGNGYNVEGPNGNSIFLPAVGWVEPDGELINEGRAAEYCSTEVGSYTAGGETYYTVQNLCFFEPEGANNQILMGTAWTYAIYLRWTDRENKRAVRLIQDP